MIRYTHETPSESAFSTLFATTGWNQAYQATPEELYQAISASWYVVSAWEDNELVGVGRVVSDGVLYAMIYDLIVLPTHQNKGIGTNLLNQIINHCQTANIRSIQLFSAQGKAAYYQKRGFVQRSDDAPGMTYNNKTHG